MSEALALEAAHRLVDHHARIGQAETLALLAGREQEGAHARRLADAQRRHVGLDELHGVVDRHPRRDRTARRVDVEEDVLVRIFRFQEQQLRHHEVGRRIIDRAHQENHPLAQQARVDVVGALAATAGLDDHRHQAQALCFMARRVVRTAKLSRTVHGLLRQDQAALPIKASNAMGVSVTLALASTQETTLFSSARASASARRCGWE
jgi:hypothetical protein